MGLAKIPDGATPIGAITFLEGEVSNEDGPIAHFEKKAIIRIYG